MDDTKNACQAGPFCFCRTRVEHLGGFLDDPNAEWEEIVDGLLEELDEYDEEMDRVNGYAAEQAARTLAAERDLGWWRRVAEARADRLVIQAEQLAELEVALISAQRQIRALESSPYGPDESI